MAEIHTQIEADLKTAMKAGDRTRVSTLRLVTSELVNRRIELRRALTRDDELEILSRAAKQRRESEEQFRGGGREEMADREAAEAEIIRAYLPEPLGPAELDRLIDEAIEQVGATSPAGMGAVMGHLMPQVKGRAEGAEVSRRVREKLAAQG
ncbi:MAG TPA: GatB/YqeY domain-containing protein [Gemmatimonadota bacterium]|nr:GatB/YqeY domain-containing protein [Gemmatimonadota bacterium]